MSYLIHFNRNHSIKTGRFMPGDGDGDGIINDHKNQKSSDDEKSSTSSGGGAITLDEDDDEEDDEKKQAAEERKIRAANLKELERRAKLKDKNKKKKSSKKGSTSKKKKKKKSKAEKAKVVADAFKTKVDEIKLKGDVPSEYSDMDINTLLKKSDGETVSLIQKILAANNQ